MADGISLALTLYLPKDGPASGQYPTIFTYTPYHRTRLDPATGSEVTWFDTAVVEFFTSYGYAMVLADMRGSGASFGTKEDMTPQLAADGRQLVDWIATQPWSNGNVGMVGGSYLGWAQLATAGTKPEALKCIMPELTAFDTYTGPVFNPGGIKNHGLNDLLSTALNLYDKNIYIPGVFLPAMPAFDEDGDGFFTDESPLDLNGNGTFLDDYLLPDNPPQYADGQTRNHLFFLATRAHLANQAVNQWSAIRPFRDDFSPAGYTYPEHGPNDTPARLAESGIPIYSSGGWFDAFARDIPQWYATMHRSNPAKLLMGPIIHSAPGMSAARGIGPYYAYFGGNPAELASSYLLERLRFLDRYLKGIDNNLDVEPPVYIYVMNGEGWRFENSWPPARRKMKRLYLNKNSSLTTTPSGNGADQYQSDFTHDTRETGSNANRWNLGALRQVALRTAQDSKSLPYSTAPLSEDTEVTGHPIVHLQISSSADDGDIFVYLEDVDENGEAYLVCDGMLRAGFAGLVDNSDILDGDTAVTVQPDLPWHGYKNNDYVDGIFSNGAIVALEFDLLPTSWVFKKGHRIRVSLATSDWPTFALNPQLSPTDNPNAPGNIIPTITVHRSKSKASFIELPVIPAGPTVFKGTAKLPANGSDFEGEAELYTFREAVYLLHDNTWLKWRTDTYTETGNGKRYVCSGDNGPLTVTVKTKDGHSTIKARGNGVHFDGLAE